MPQLTRTLFLGGQNLFLEVGQNFGVGLLFSEFSVDLKKKSSCQCGLLFSEFDVDLQKKKSHLAKLFYLFPSFLLVSKKKPPS